jgi:hypothetical protein
MRYLQMVFEAPWCLIFELNTMKQVMLEETEAINLVKAYFE